MHCVKIILCTFFICATISHGGADYQVDNLKATPWRPHVNYISKYNFTLEMSDAQLFLYEKEKYDRQKDGFYTNDPEKPSITGGKYSVIQMVSSTGLPQNDKGQFGIHRRYGNAAIEFKSSKAKDTGTLKLYFRYPKNKKGVWRGTKEYFFPSNTIKVTERIRTKEDWFGNESSTLGGLDLNYAFKEMFQSFGEDVNYELRWDKKAFKTGGERVEVVSATNSDNRPINKSTKLANEYLKAELNFLHYAIFGQDKPREPGEYWEISAKTINALLPPNGVERLEFEGKLVVKAEKINPTDIPKEVAAYSGIKVSAVHSGIDGKGRKIETNLKLSVNGKNIRCDFPRIDGDRNKFIVHLDTNFEHVRSVDCSLVFENYEGDIPEIGERLKLHGFMKGTLSILFDISTEIKNENNKTTNLRTQ